MVRWMDARVGMVLAAGAACVAMAWSPLARAQTPVQLERVEVTGSSVRRIDGETALPVQVFTREDIKRSGATTVVDLFRQLPVMQGALGHTSSLAGETYGYANVSIHNLDDVRTLVLLNGHRLTSYGGQTINGFASAFDINALPVSAIERIEVLADGASALYGSDAIAGVVNVITRRNSTEGDVTLGVSSPRGGAKEKRLSISKGFGSLADDGHNLLLVVSHEERSELLASSRDYARSAQVDFRANGQRYRISQGSINSAPANVVHFDANPAVNDWVYFNPYYRANGNCGPGQYPQGDAATGTCAYDYVRPIQIYPEQRRDSFFASFTAQPSTDLTLFADLLLSRSKQTTRTAPSSAYESEIAPGSPLHDRYFAPQGISDSVWSYTRLVDMGQRVSEDTSDFGDLVLGAKGRSHGWDYRSEFAHSESHVRSYIANYVGQNTVHGPISSGVFDPFLLPGQQSAAGLAALDAINYRGYWNGGTAKLDTASLRLSRELAPLPGGPMVLGTGLSVTREHFQALPSAFAQGLLSDPAQGTVAAPGTAGDIRFDQSGVVLPYAVSRRSLGVFGEVVFPVMKQLELTASARHDHYSDFGNTSNLKGSFRFTDLSRQWLLRGSLGTGFRAPSGPQRNAPLQSYGRAGAYACTPELQAQADRLGAQCRPADAQYDLLAGGNPEIEPERSVQANLGLRFEPTRQLTLGADLWFVRINQALGSVLEGEAFNNPGQYPELWTTVSQGGNTYLAFIDKQRNLGRSYASGVDFDISGRQRTAVGDLGSQLVLSVLLRQESQILPTSPFFSTVGDFGPHGYVAFRWKARWATSLKAGDWTHTFTANARSGYWDREETVQPIDDNGNPVGPEVLGRLKVKRFFTADWQTDWALRKDWRLTLGVLNLFDRAPPLSLASIGLNKGQQVGFDDRYYDPRGRTGYVNASYKF